MNSQLTLDIARAHQHDLRRSAERWNTTAGTDRRARRIARRNSLRAILRPRLPVGPGVARPATSH